VIRGFFHHSGASGTPGVLSPGQAPSHVGQVETVRFHVGYVYADANGTEFLDQYQDYASGFIVTIYASDLANFQNDPASTYGD